MKNSEKGQDPYVRESPLSLGKSLVTEKDDLEVDFRLEKRLSTIIIGMLKLYVV